MEMCRSNAAEKLAEHLGRAGKQTAALDELARLLGLEAPPEYIEAYDISHTAGSDNVAGMVVFRGGVPYKQAYKRFSIKSFEGQDDYGSMNEVLTRRFTHYVEEKRDWRGLWKAAGSDPARRRSGAGERGAPGASAVRPEGALYLAW